MLEVWEHGSAGEAEAAGETHESSFTSDWYQVSRLGFRAGKEQGVAEV